MNELKLATPAAAETKETFRRYVEEVTGWHVEETNIKKISVHAFSNRIKRKITSDICVGQELDYFLSEIPHEPVLAIFKANKYLVVTPDKLKSNRIIYLFDEQDVLGVEADPT